MARAVLEEPLVRRALALEVLVRTRSPFALVRAVEFAEILLTREAVVVRADDGSSGRRK